MQIEDVGIRNPPMSVISRKKDCVITGQESPQAEYGRWRYRRVMEYREMTKGGSRKWHKDNREKHLEQMREWYEKNKEQANKRRTENRRKKRESQTSSN